VLPAIHFNDQSRRVRSEIRDEMPDRNLPSKARTGKSGAQDSPHRFFGLGRITPQPLGARYRTGWGMMFHKLRSLTAITPT